MSENNANNTDNVNNKKSTYFKDSQKRYGDKCVKYTVKYTLNESDISAVVVDVIGKSGLTANRWIKDAIKEKLKKDGFLSESAENMPDAER